ncbi:hypothetical protein CY34DRAFT_97812, partial [Suillus luteus UH-Slu-Lm8-n1]
GGYNLQEKLGWSLSEYEDVHIGSFVIHLALEYLNVQRSWKAQLTPQLKVVFSEAKSPYPVLDDYKDDWVVSDFLWVYLKNSSTRTN